MTAFTQPTTGPCRESDPTTDPPVIPAWTDATLFSGRFIVDGQVVGHGYTFEVRAKQSGAVSPVRYTPTIWPGNNVANTIIATGKHRQGKQALRLQRQRHARAALAGSHTFDGGDGTDTVTYEHLSDTYGIIVDMRDPANRNDGAARGDAYVSIEGNHRQRKHNDLIIGADAGSMTLSGGKGDDELHGLGGMQHPERRRGRRLAFRARRQQRHAERRGGRRQAVRQSRSTFTGGDGDDEFYALPASHLSGTYGR